jgi:hypothetical protein
MAVKVGDVFNYPGTESDGFGFYVNKGGWHIHIVVKVDETGGDVYLVPLTSVLYSDRTCEIEMKDGCPLVVKPSVVAYLHGKIIRLDALQEQGRLGGQAPKELLARIIAGIRTSPKSEQWFKDAVCPRPAGRILPITSDPPTPPTRW